MEKNSENGCLGAGPDGAFCPGQTLPAMWLKPWEQRALFGLLAAVLLFGALVVWRTAFLQQRKGDLEVFLRTAWAARSGEDIYQVTDSHGFHYLYPPLFAILLAPLADPPAGVGRSWCLPFAASTSVWYLFNVLCLVVAVHWLASALEQRSSERAGQGWPAGSRRWWAFRLVPILACMPPIGHTLMRGQVGLLLLLLLSAMAAALLHGRRFQAGLWLAGAICLKVIPAFLLIYPCWRRDGRCLAGCLVGLVAGLAVIPAAVFGPARTLAYYQEWTEVMLLPAMANGKDQSRAKELLEVTATDSQSLLATLHNTLHLNRSTRPAQADAWTRRAHWLAGAFLTVLALLAAGWQCNKDATATVLFFGVLTLLMLLLSPVCHLHYFCLSVPVLVGLLAAVWEREPIPRLSRGLLVLLLTNVIANALPHFPGLELLRDLGLAMYAALLLWIIGSIVLWKRTHLGLAVPAEQSDLSGAAA